MHKCVSMFVCAPQRNSQANETSQLFIIKGLIHKTICMTSHRRTLCQPYFTNAASLFHSRSYCVYVLIIFSMKYDAR